MLDVSVVQLLLLQLEDGLAELDVGRHPIVMGTPVGSRLFAAGSFQGRRLLGLLNLEMCQLLGAAADQVKPLRDLCPGAVTSGLIF